MNGELIWVLSLLLIAIILFATGKVRMDAVALFVIVAFVLSGTLTLPEAFSGFSDPNVILIAALFIACWNLFSGRDHEGNAEELDADFIEEGKNPPDL